MAGTLTLSFSLNYVGTDLTIPRSEPTTNFTIAGADGLTSVQAIGTANEAITFEDTTAAWIFLKNLDATNYVSIYNDNMDVQKVCKLLPGEYCFLKTDGATTFYAKANAAGIDLLKIGIPL